MKQISRMAALLVLVACSAEAAGPRPLHTVVDGLPAGLNVQFSVTPATVKQNQSFDALLEITNESGAAVTITTGHGCLAVPNVMRGNASVPVQGSRWGCTAAITNHTFAPGETREIRWPMKATLYADEPGAEDGAPLPPGTYSVQAEFDVYVPGSNRKPVVEAPFIVE